MLIYKPGDEIEVRLQPDGNWYDGKFIRQLAAYPARCHVILNGEDGIIRDVQLDNTRPRCQPQTSPIFHPNQRIEYLEDSAWLPGIYLETSHVEGFPYRVKCDSGKILCAAEGSIRAADLIPYVQMNAYPSTDKVTSQYIVWTSGGDPVCTIEAANFAEAQSILKFQTPGPTFLEVCDRFFDDDYGSLNLPTHKQWVEAKMVKIEAKRAEKEVSSTTQPTPPSDPIPTPTTFKWGQLVMVDGGTDNARQGIVICDQPSQTDRSWFVSLPNCCNGWIREDRLTTVEAGKVELDEIAAARQEGYNQALLEMKSKPATQEQGETPTPHGYEGYGWIKVKKFEPDKYATIEERYTALDMHHIQETSFLIDKVRELASQIVDNSPYLGGQTVPIAEHQAATELLEVRNYELDYFSETVSNFRIRCHRLSGEAKEAAHYAHSCPEHTQSTLKTLAFRLDCLARGVVGGE